jgi:NADPH-dependent ferric siderophore reductase
LSLWLKPTAPANQTSQEKTQSRSREAALSCYEASRVSPTPRRIVGRSVVSAALAKLVNAASRLRLRVLHDSGEQAPRFSTAAGRFGTITAWRASLAWWRSAYRTTSRQRTDSCGNSKPGSKGP